MTMQLIDDWRHVLRRAWSIRLILLAGVLSGVEAALSLAGGIPGVPSGAFAALSGVIACAAFAARLVAQKEATDGGK